MTRSIAAGKAELLYPSEQLKVLDDSSHLLGDYVALHHKLQEDGYLFLKNFHKREDVAKARSAVLQYMIEVEKSRDQNIFDGSEPKTRGILDEQCGRGCVPYMEGKNSITHHPDVLKLIAGDHVYEFFYGLFGENAMTFDFKWLRAMYKEGFTGTHVDNVYMSRGTEKLITLWTPFQDTSVEMGTLLLCQGSHRLKGFEEFQRTYGSTDIEAEKLHGTGWFGTDPVEITQRFGGQWRTADFNAGDVVLFTIRTVHMSSTNTTRIARISCDTRWQPVSQQADPRFVGSLDESRLGKSYFGNWADDVIPDDAVTMEQLRARWGFS